MKLAKLSTNVCLLILVAALLILTSRIGHAAKASSVAQVQPGTPADGYTIHVTAPHNVNGHIMGPFHHFCKVMQPDPPIIVCQIYDSADPNATLSQIEFIVAKKLTRPAVSLSDWNRLWHDHATEIATGRVQVLDLPPDKAKAVADLVTTTDGIIYTFDFDHGLPNGKVTMAQAVGHRPLTEEEYKQSQKATAAGTQH